MMRQEQTLAGRAALSPDLPSLASKLRVICASFKKCTQMCWQIAEETRWDHPEMGMDTEMLGMCDVHCIQLENSF